MKIWRIIISIILFEIIGSTIAYLINSHYSAFDRIWLGGASSAIVGFIIGFLWQISNTTRRKDTPILITLFVGIITILLATTAITSRLPKMNREMQLLAKLQSIENNQVERIEVFNEYGTNRIKIINDSNIINEFVFACETVEGFSPNHPLYTHSWYLLISGKEKYEIECHFEKNRPNNLDIYFVNKNGNTTHYYGTFTSIQLRKWFEKYIL